VQHLVVEDADACAQHILRIRIDGPVDAETRLEIGDLVVPQFADFHILEPRGQRIGNI